MQADSLSSESPANPLMIHIRLEMIKLSENGMPKVKTVQIVYLLCQTVDQVVNAKEKFLKEIKNATLVNTSMIGRWNSLFVDKEKVLGGLDRKANQLQHFSKKKKNNNKKPLNLEQGPPSLKFYEGFENEGV